MSQGIILLLVLAAIVAYVVTRTRRRMGLLVTAKTWIAVMTGFVIVVLTMWAVSSSH
jgi:predicted PurR-regulated permease PerM